MEIDAPFAVEIAGAVLSLIVLVLIGITYRIFQTAGTSRLPSDESADMRAVIKRIDELDEAERQRMEKHELNSRQRSESLTRCLGRYREQQALDDKFEAMQREIEKLRNGKT